MKKIFVVLIAFCFINISLSNAQTNRGRVLLGVSSALSLSGLGPNILSVGYSTTKHKSNASGYTEPDPDKSMSINLLPRFGVFIFNNFAFGADLCLGYNNQKDGNSSIEYDQTIFGAGPFIRYYIPTNKIRPFIEFNAVFGSDHTKYTSSDTGFNSDTKNNRTSFGAGFGLAFPIGEKATFDIMASYTDLILKDKENNPDNNRSESAIMSLKFGFTIYLGSAE